MDICDILIILEATVCSGLADGPSWISMLLVSKTVNEFTKSAIAKNTMISTTCRMLMVSDDVLSFSCDTNVLSDTIYHGPIWGVNYAVGKQQICYLYTNYWFGDDMRRITTMFSFAPNRNKVTRHVLRTIVAGSVRIKSVFGTAYRSIDDVCACGVELCRNCAYKYAFGDLPLLQKIRIEIRNHDTYYGDNVDIRLNYRGGGKTIHVTTHYDVVPSRKQYVSKMSKKYYELVKKYIPSD